MAKFWKEMGGKFGLAGLAGYGLSKALGGKNKGGSGGDQWISPPPYGGLRPYSGPDVGLGAPELKTLADQYRQQLLDRSQGRGLVGFEPSYRDILRKEYLADFGDYEQDVQDRASAQASGQGLRGGIPLSIGAEHTKNLSRARQAGLSEIDIADLQARREDINKATYAQPELVNLGSDIQGRRAAFDLAEYEGSMPAYLQDEPQENTWLPALLTAAGTIGGAYFGGPTGAAVGGTVGGTLGQSLSQSRQDRLLKRPGYFNDYRLPRRGEDFRY